MKRPMNKYFIILLTGFVLWIAETIAFGLHKTPQSDLEWLIDMVAIIMMLYGVIGDISTNLRITKTYHNVTNIKTNKVNFQDEPKIMSYNVGINSNKDDK